MQPWVEKTLSIVGVSAVYSLYWPINGFSAGLEGHDLTMAIDRATPLVPGWIYVYALLFVTGYLPVLVVRDIHLFRRIIVAALGLEICALTTFVLFPVHMSLRPEVLPPGDSLTAWGMHFMYWLDEPSNCFPSLHVGAAALAAASVWKADRVVSGIAGGLLVLVAASTMLVKQHYFADVVFAVVLVALLYRVAIAPLDASDRSVEEMRNSRAWLWVIPALYALMIGAFVVAYDRGFAPWAGG